MDWVSAFNDSSWFPIVAKIYGSVSLDKVVLLGIICAETISTYMNGYMNGMGVWNMLATFKINKY